MDQNESFQRDDIAFDSNGVTCRGWHYRPAQPAAHPAPCIVMAHGLGGTIDAGLAPYAEQFAGAGFQVLVFDYRHFGISDGHPRQLLQVGRQLADWRAAVSHARGLDGVDPARVALWGTSFSGGHVIMVAAGDASIAAVAAQGPMMDGRAATLNLLRYAGVGMLARLGARGLADQVKAWFGGEPVTLPLIAQPGELAAMTSHDAERGYRAIVPAGWRNEMTARAMLTLALYRPIAHAHRIACPVLIQACMQDSVAPAAAAVKLAGKLEEKATLKQYDIGHFDIYVGKDHEQAVKDQLAFFQAHLL